MTKPKHTIDDFMTIGEAAVRYGVSIDKVKNRLKPSKIGQEQIDKWVDAGLIRFSGGTWIISIDFMEIHFKK